jgi:quercetin dioxygenase-like cupin family protein
VKLSDFREGMMDWSTIVAELTPGASASAAVQTRRIGDVQLRIVEYLPGYVADHWCSKGHVLYVLAGELTIEHQNDQPDYILSTGMSWYAADGEGGPHRVRSATGATIFILD